MASAKRRWQLKRLCELVFRPPAADSRRRTSSPTSSTSSPPSSSQKGIYEYSRARAGHYAKVLFTEPEFIEAVERARWRAYPLGLAMVAELVEGVLRPQAGDERRASSMRSARARLCRSSTAIPCRPTLSADDWRGRARELARRLELIGLHPPKRAMDIPEPFAEGYFDLMPIHKKLRGSDFPTIHNYLKVTMCNIHDELSKRVDAVAVSEQLRARAG